MGTSLAILSYKRKRRKYFTSTGRRLDKGCRNKDFSIRSVKGFPFQMLKHSART